MRAKMVPILARADHSHSATNEIKTHEAVEFEIAFTGAIVGAWNLAIEREEQGNRKLGHRVWRIIGDADDFDAKLLCRSQVDMIEAGGAGRNQLGTAGGELFQYIAIDHVVYDYAHRREPRRQRCRPGSEEGIEVDELVPVTGVQLV